MKRVAMLATAIAAMTCCTNVLADTVTRALVTGLGGWVELYDVDSSGSWTKVGTICQSGASSTVKRSIRAFCRNGVVYVGDMLADQSESGYIRKFSLAGDYLGDLTDFDFRLDIVPDIFLKSLAEGVARIRYIGKVAVIGGGAARKEQQTCRGCDQCREKLLVHLCCLQKWYPLFISFSTGFRQRHPRPERIEQPD